MCPRDICMCVAVCTNGVVLISLHEGIGGWRSAGHTELLSKGPRVAAGGTSEEEMAAMTGLVLLLWAGESAAASSLRLSAPWSSRVTHMFSVWSAGSSGTTFISAGF